MPRRHRRHPDGPTALVTRLEELVLSAVSGDPFEPILAMLASHAHLRRHGDSPTPAALRNNLASLRAAHAPHLDFLGELPFSNALLRACLEPLERYESTGDPHEALDAAVEVLTSLTSKSNKGQYFTPRHVIELCVRMVAPRAGERVSDPTCGSGGFLMATRRLADAAGEASPTLLGADYDARAVRVAATLLALGGAPNGCITERNTLEHLDDQSDDVVLANPPFAGQIVVRSVLDRFELGRGRRTVERDVLFLERCVRQLRLGGRLAIVLPHQTLAGQSAQDVRAWLLRNTRVWAVVGLHRSSFLPHTHQKAGIVIAERRDGGTPNDAPIFFAISERAGKDSRGRAVLKASNGRPRRSAWECLDHDLDELHAEWSAFARREAVPWFG